MPNAPFLEGNEDVPKIRKRRKPTRKPEVAVKEETGELIKKENLMEQVDKAVSDVDDHEHDDHPPSSPLSNTEDPTTKSPPLATMKTPPIPVIPISKQVPPPKKE